MNYYSIIRDRKNDEAKLNRLEASVVKECKEGFNIYIIYLQYLLRTLQLPASNFSLLFIINI